MRRGTKRKEAIAAAQERGEEGALPDFLVIGAQKGGTSFFHRLLVNHPLVRPAAAKEIHYFDQNFNKGLSWYRRCFKPRARRQGRETLAGEATPSYLFHPHAPERIAETLPDAKLVALLRDPADRAYSHYHMEKRRGREARTFADAVADEIAGKEGPPYLARGRYAEQLAHYSGFARRGLMLVLRSEDLFARREETYNRALDFLGLPPAEPKPIRPGSKSGYEPMDPAVRDRLEEYFAPHNRELREQQGIDFGR